MNHSKSIIIKYNIQDPKSPEKEAKKEKIINLMRLFPKLESQDIITHLSGEEINPDGSVPTYAWGSTNVSYFLTDEPDIVFNLVYTFNHKQKGKRKYLEFRVPSSIKLTITSHALDREISLEEFLTFYVDSMFAKKIIFNLDILKSEE